MTAQIGLFPAPTKTFQGKRTSGKPGSRRNLANANRISEKTDVLGVGKFGRSLVSWGEIIKMAPIWILTSYSGAVPSINKLRLPSGVTRGRAYSTR